MTSDFLNGLAVAVVLLAIIMGSGAIGAHYGKTLGDPTPQQCESVCTEMFEKAHC